MTDDEFWKLNWPGVQENFHESVTHAITDALHGLKGPIEFESALYFWSVAKSHVESWVREYEGNLAQQLDTKNLGYWMRRRERRKNRFLLAQYRRMLESTATHVFRHMVQ